MHPLQRHADAPELQEAVADAFCEVALKACEENGVFNVSLSGGSTPKKLYELLSKRDLPWDKTHWFWGDERNVPHDHADSNCRMVREALLSHVPVPESNIHAVPVNVNDPQSAANEYDKTIRDHFQGGPAKWDLALLGMGDDAHTASLFPGTKALDETARAFVANWVEKFDAWRYTLTHPAINSASEIWFLIAGANKRDALAAVRGDAKDVQQFPSQLVRPTRWYITEDAIA